MKITPPRHYNHKSLVVPPIPIEREEQKTLRKEKVQTFKCRTDPSNRDSPAYEVYVPYFSDGTPEQWIYFLRTLKQVMKGQGDTTSVLVQWWYCHRVKPSVVPCRKLRKSVQMY